MALHFNISPEGHQGQFSRICKVNPIEARPTGPKMGAQRAEWLVNYPDCHGLSSNKMYLKMPQRWSLFGYLVPMYIVRLH